MIILKQNEFEQKRNYTGRIIIMTMYKKISKVLPAANDLT